ncbi:hypothetical protein D3C83_21830 [compost metagenome]
MPAHALGDADGTVAVLADGVVHFREEFFLVEGDFREQQDVRCFAFLVLGEPARRGDPAGVPSHHFQDEDAGRGARHGGDVVAGLADAGGDVLGDRAEAGAGVGDREVVVHGLGDADAGEGIAQRPCDLRHLV